MLKAIVQPKEYLKEKLNKPACLGHEPSNDAEYCSFNEAQLRQNVLMS